MHNFYNGLERADEVEVWRSAIDRYAVSKNNKRTGLQLQRRNDLIFRLMASDGY
jgi:hypothetical protein